MTVAESFLVFSVALSVFAACAVTGATLRMPRQWKRLIAVCIFASMAIGLACLSLHLRHYSFERALESRAEAYRNYSGWIAAGSTDPFVVDQLEWVIAPWWTPSALAEARLA